MVNMSPTAVKLDNFVGSLEHVQANRTVSALVEQDILHWFLFSLQEHLLFELFPLMFFFRFEFIFSDASKSHGEGGELIKTSSLDNRPEVGYNDESPAA